MSYSPSWGNVWEIDTPPCVPIGFRRLCRTGRWHHPRPQLAHYLLPQFRFCTGLGRVRLSQAEPAGFEPFAVAGCTIAVEERLVLLCGQLYRRGKKERRQSNE